MELAMHLGGPFESLTEGMTEREFTTWVQYARKRMLPMRRLELYLARILMAVDHAFGGGGRGKKLSDYMLDDLLEIPQEDEDAEVGADFGFNPRFKK